jgi:hypothetical protein
VCVCVLAGAVAWEGGAQNRSITRNGVTAPAPGHACFAGQLTSSAERLCPQKGAYWG